MAKVYDFLRAYEARRAEVPAPRFLLVGAVPSEQVEIPESLFRVLVKAVEALSDGKGVTIAPQEPQLTTQQAAELLGVSRPTVVRLIESGDLPAERVDSRRRLALGDVLAFRDRRRAKQYAMLESTSVYVDFGEDPKLIVEKARAARSRVALGQ